MKCYTTSSQGIAKKGVEYVVDCHIGEHLELRDIAHLRELVESALRRALAIEEPGTLLFESNEPIGASYMLYKFNLKFKESLYVGVRVVVRGRRPTRILFTVPRGVRIRVKTPISKYEPAIQQPTPQISATKAAHPPGQVYISYPVIYSILGVPEVDASKWYLSVEGEVNEPLKLTLRDLYELGIKVVKTDFHCVTGWSVGGLEFAGVEVKKLFEIAGLKPSAKWLFAESLDGYTTIMPIEDALSENSIVAVEMNGKPLDILHGYPARLVVPHLYGWKSAKWVKRLVATSEYRDGYWEALGYHARGRVDLEERFKQD
ncbi:MAG: molybdopterin-dependent oxidoreductase [Desulfurococcaceae archaeon]